VPLDSTLRERFARDGYVIVDAFQPAQVETLRAAYTSTGELDSLGFAPTIFSSDPAYRADVDRRIRAVLAPVIDELIEGFRICFCSWAVKQPGRNDGALPLHQDISFVDDERHISIGVWAPLIDVGPENGCLSVVRGTHVLHSTARTGPFPYGELETLIRARCLTELPMRAGEMMLFDERLFHCSPPNRSASLRVAVAAVLAPHGSTMRYYQALGDGRAEVFEVADDFYIRHTLFRM